MIALSAAYAVLLGVVVLSPERIDGMHGERIEPVLRLLAGWGVPRAAAYDVIESAANVVLFVPGGLLVVALLSFRWRWWVPVLGVAISTAAELAQHTWLPDRVADPRDIVADAVGFTLGGVIGVLIGVALHRRHARPSPAPSADQAATTPVPSSTSSTTPSSTR
ncbi:VanZ family protein [Schumannella sp. 10F1B-5-1]|uniref:VanZ family protein n=1 Tax=Schumannella sp. 10F1B-5-1 TaxID=2590780 RepID=UPI0015E876B0|nr:VanZ family protein [Schumannella sp. 10F1B-5-1]